ncbi:MAG: Ig-like domain-containing protein [Deltaproteobacteria bacterium]|nr:Ig-like domain-containing protein [Deltaproteobacteria bacterium]
MKDDLASGTEIINCADVYFPSADEVTPTNCVVNIVNTIAADPQTVETISEIPASITLTGRDSGASTVAYEITLAPIYGTLTGTPPNVSYTSMEGFSGQDEFYFVVNNGLVDSEPAKVTIKVNPNPLDINPPEVTETYPEADAINVHVDETPVSEDPKHYIPTITATFSEQIDSETVTTDTFTVEGLTGYAYYDEQSRAAYFMPSTALSTSTTYTAKLSTGIKDKIGNPLISDFSWQFTTESPANIAVTLPDNADEINFGDVLINTASGVKIVSIASTGTEDLVLDSIMLTGTDPEEFRITEDNCSGGTLTQFMNCTVKVLCEPVSTGIKNANLSIPSNDTDEETVEVTLSCTCVAEPFWPALYGEMWTVDREKNLSTLRSFRDDVLSQSKMGQEYIYAIYSNSLEAAALLINNPSLLIRTREVISGLMPEIQCLLEGEEMSLSQDQLGAIERLLDEFEIKASPNLRTEIMKVKKDINGGDIFNKLGIVINE